MAAVKLVTRCPACRTAFRLVADQLRLRQGLVRCGHCETVFDAREHLIEIPVPAGSATPPASAVPATTTPTAATPAPAAEAARPGESAPASQPAPAPFTPFTPTIDPGYDVPALDAPTMLMTSPADLDVAAPPHADVHEDEIERALREANDAVAQRDARDAERQADIEPAPQQTPATETAREAEPMAESEPEPEAKPGPEPEAQPEPERKATHDAEATATHAAPQPAEPEVAAPAWPALNHNALDHPALEEPARIGKAGEPEAEARGKAEAPAPQPDAVPAPAAIPSASEFLRAASADIGPPPAIHPAPADTPESAAEPSESKAAERTDTSDTRYGRDAGPAPDTGAPASITGEAVAREQTTRRWTRAEAPAGPVFAPDFLRHARERERERAPARSRAPAPRTLWYAAAAVLALGATVQAVYLARSPLAGQFPMLRPALEAACAPFGCDVPPWRDIDALRIESSQLQRLDEGGDAYMLAVTLRNLGRATTALPAIELVMTDLQDQLLLRRVLQPADYLDPSQKAFATEGLRAGMELPVRVRFRTQQAPSNYRVLIFYP